ncbi:MAG: hypothetical protein PHX62_00245, partial [Bacilli bacterium]|nr:hypothetical protein [Bacilli bacterium]
MKKLFKTIFILLIVLVLFVGGTLLTLYLVVSDNTDNAPTDLYTSEVSVEGEIDDLFSRFFVNHDDAFYLAFTEDDLNRLLFAFLKNANANYYSGCESDECQYFLTQEIPSSVPIIGGDKLYIKHAYAEITDNGLNFYLTLKTPYFNTNLNLGFDFEEEEGTYILTLNKLGLGGMNLMTSLGKKISGPMLDALGMGEDSINQMILENGLPLEFKLEDYSFRFEKEDLGEMVISLLGDDEGVENTLLNDFVNLLSSSENDLLNFGFFELDDEKQFGFQIDLNEIKTTIAI